MNKQIRWLMAEIDRWTAEGLVSPEQATRLRQRYPQPAEGPPWALLVFASAGAVVIGLGIILLFAYNWKDIPKFGKLALIFGAVIAAHTGGLVLYRKDGWQRKLGEALSLLGTMFYGSAIWLIAQIYHIDEHYPNGFLFWALGALALAWVLESIPQALLATVLFAIWGGAETLNFDSPNYWAILAVLGGIGPLAWRKRSGVLTATVLATVYFLTITTLLDYGNGAHALTSILALSVLLIGGEKLLRQPDGEPVAGTSVWLFFGFSGFLVCTYLLGFHQAADDLLDWHRRNGSNPSLAGTYGWLLFFGGLSCWATVAWKAFKAKNLAVPVEEWLCPIALVYSFLLAAQPGLVGDRFIAITFNLVSLGIAVSWMLRGCREARLRPTVLGSLLLAALVFARYFDLFQSLASRGLTFIILGGVLMAEALYYRKSRREERTGRGGAS